MNADGVSVIICCYNSASRIPETLKYLQQQKEAEHIPWEVLLIDNASTDNTAETARNLWHHQTPLHIVFEQKPGLSNARMAGIKNARYELLSFIDDDNWVCENWVNKTYHTMKTNSDVAMCGGFGEPVFESTPPDWFNKFQQAYAVGEQGLEEGYVDISRGYLYGAGSTIRKSAWDFMDSNGFIYLLTGRKGKGLSSGEDMELCMAFMIAGFRLWYNPELKFKHYLTTERLSWKYLIKLFRAFGKSDAYTELYSKHLNERWGLKNKVQTHSLFSIIYIAYKLLKFLPGYIYAKNSDSEGSYRILFFNRYIYSMMERIRILPHIGVYEKKITDAHWFQSTTSIKNDQ